MEASILRAIALLVWMALDKQILVLVEKIAENDLDGLFKIMRIKDQKAWLSKRYSVVKSARYLWILSPFIPSVLLDVLVLLLTIILYKQKYYWLKQKAIQKRLLMRYQFPIYLRQLQVLLQNNTVLTSFQLSISQAPMSMKEDIQTMVDHLCLHPNQLEEYMTFLEYYHLPEIQRAMKWMYRYQYSGALHSYHHFNRMIVATSKWLRQERSFQKSKHLLVSQWWGLVPLLAVSLVFMSAMMQIMMNLFERR